MREQFETRLAKLEDRVDELERRDSGAPSDGAVPTAGWVAYNGDVHLHGDITWSVGCSPETVLDSSVTRTAEVLAALGHPVRLQIVRTLLRGPANVSDLQGAVGGSTGQVYHHLKTLGSANIVEQHGRGDFQIGTTNVVPLLVSMLAAMDISGELGT